MPRSPDPGEALPSLFRWSVGLATVDDGDVIDHDTAARLTGACRDQRITGVLVAACRSAGLDPYDRRLDELADTHDAAMVAALGLEAAALEATARLGEAGIEHRLLKGVALAHLPRCAVLSPGVDGSGSAERDVGDLDLLVADGRVRSSVAVLHGFAAVAAPHPLGPDYDDHWGKGVTMRTADRWEVDLHRTLAPGPWGLRVRPEDLWAAPAEVDLGGTFVPTLPESVHLAHAVLHAALSPGGARLQNLRDVVLLDRAPDPTRSAARRLLTAWGAAEPVRRVEARLRSLGAGGLATLAPLPVGPTTAERLWMRANDRWPERFGLHALLALGQVPARDRAAYLRALSRTVRGRGDRERRGGTSTVGG